jgi:threonine aldolase
MNFGSDNWAGAHPAIMKSLTTHSTGFSVPYGEGDLDFKVEKRLSEIFEREVAVFFVATGTASNCLALTSVGRPGGIVFAHRDAHIIVDECGGPEWFSGQLRLQPVDGADGKMDLAELRRHVDRVAALDVHGGRPNAISVTQPSESGTVHSLENLDAIAKIAKEHNLPLHMDGARFANALTSLGCTPAEMTWKRGVDILSFGGTKNGCWCAEAVIYFDTSKAQDFPFLRKRAGQLISKSRFVSAQLDAYLHDGLWLDLARHSNAMASSLAAVFEKSKLARLTRTPTANEIFVVLKNEAFDGLKSHSVEFMEWPIPADVDVGKQEKLCRFVTSFATTSEEIQSVSRLLNSSRGN